jgi:uncharacterized membrane protein YcjF (UPF0283 family)
MRVQTNTCNNCGRVIGNQYGVGSHCPNCNALFVREEVYVEPRPRQVYAPMPNWTQTMLQIVGILVGLPLALSMIALAATVMSNGDLSPMIGLALLAFMALGVTLCVACVRGLIQSARERKQRKQALAATRASS